MHISTEPLDKYAADRATWQEPAALAAGVVHVLIGGALAIEAGRPANLRLGRVLRRPQTSGGYSRVSRTKIQAALMPPAKGWL